MAITAAAGGGNWNTGGTWVGGIAPTAADDVLLTVTSGNVTINGTSGSESKCRSLNCTGYTGTLTHGSSNILQIGDGTVGHLTLVAGMTYTPNSISVIQFISTTGPNNITTAGKSMGQMIFNGAGGSWTLQDTLTVQSSTSRPLTLTAGTLDTNNQTCTLAGSFSSNNSNVRTLTLGSSTINISGSTSPQWDCGATTTNMTLNANTSTIVLSVSAGAATFAGGGLTYNSLTMTQAGSYTITGANTFTGTFNRTGTAVKTDSLTLSANQTVSGTLSLNGNSEINRLLIASNLVGTARTITSASNSITYADFRDITGAGAGSWNLSAITGLSGDGGGNSGITFTSPINCYMKTAVSVSWSASNWFTTSGGAVAARVPLLQDTAILDVNSVTAASKTITMDMPRTGSINWTGVANTPAFSTGSPWDVYGGLILVAGMTHTGGGTLTFRGRSSFDFDDGGLSWPAGPITLNAPTGTLNQLSSFAAGTNLTIAGGTWSMGGDITLSGATSISGGAVSGASFTVSGGTTWAGSGGAWNASFSGTSITGAAGTHIFPTLTLSGAFSAGNTSGTVTIGAGGMTCTDLTLGGAGSSLNFTSGSGLINCSGNASQSGNQTSVFNIGAGGLSCVTYAISTGAGVPTLNIASGATITLTGTGTVWANTGGTINANSGSTIVINDSSATSKTFAGNGKTYGNITLKNNTIITGANTFNVIALNNPADATGITFPASTTTTCSDITTTGSAGNLAKIISSSSGTAATLNCSGLVDLDYISIKDSTAANHTPFYAGANSTNVSGNTNWIFADRPLGGLRRNTSLNGLSPSGITQFNPSLEAM